MSAFVVSGRRRLTDVVAALWFSATGRRDKVVRADEGYIPLQTVEPPA